MYYHRDVSIGKSTIFNPASPSYGFCGQDIGMWGFRPDSAGTDVK